MYFTHTFKEHLIKSQAYNDVLIQIECSNQLFITKLSLYVLG